MDKDKEILVGCNKLLYIVTHDTLRCKMAIELDLRDEEADMYYELIGVFKSKPWAFFEADHGKNIIIYNYKTKKTVKKILLNNEVYKFEISFDEKYFGIIDINKEVIIWFSDTFLVAFAS